MPTGLVGMIFVIELISLNVVVVRSGAYDVVEDVVAFSELFVSIKEYWPRLVISQAPSTIHIIDGTYSRGI